MNFREFFKFRRANPAKLKEYGFREKDGVFTYETPFLNGQFTLSVIIGKDGNPSAKLTDALTREEYVLHLIEDSVGEFVGSVRREFETVLSDVRDRCFDKEIFKSEQAKQVVSYMRDKYGDEPEYLWEKSPENAVWRRKDNRKWYAVLMVIPQKRLYGNETEPTDIIDLRIDPMQIECVVDNVRFFAGYHMNKKHWITVCLNDTVPLETVYNMIDASYALAFKK